METGNTEGRESSRGADDWLVALRTRMVELARRRVQPDDVEDVVQTAMRVVIEKGLQRTEREVEGLPPIAWCLQVLRNTIGNHYKRQRTQKKWVDSAVEADRVSIPIEAMSSAEKLETIEGALAKMMQEDPQCGSYLQRTLDGSSAREIAAEDGLDADAFYKRLYRCRRKLREWLRERGVLPE
jgi:RNA polymerase sigma factor (sigma-70 family)